MDSSLLYIETVTVESPELGKKFFRVSPRVALSILYKCFFPGLMTFNFHLLYSQVIYS